MSHADRFASGIRRDRIRRNVDGVETISVREWHVKPDDLEVVYEPDEVHKALWGPQDRMAKHLQPSQPPRWPNTPRRPYRLLRAICVASLIVGTPLWMTLHSKPAKAAEQPFLLLIWYMTAQGEPKIGYIPQASADACAKRIKEIAAQMDADDTIVHATVACAPLEGPSETQTMRPTVPAKPGSV